MEKRYMNLKYAPLFEPLTLGNGIQLKNRIVMAPSKITWRIV
jgi:2,4-dienoyl-CoA reductase-like NADH-dependent reductase (Old Yellow Enzyme family)